MNKLSNSKFEGVMNLKNQKFVEIFFITKDMCTTLQDEQKWSFAKIVYL